jgi:hypothetical protein
LHFGTDWHRGLHAAAAEPACSRVVCAELARATGRRRHMAPPLEESVQSKRASAIKRVRAGEQAHAGMVDGHLWLHL